jgi:Acyl-CoA dehydrogenases
MELEADDSGLRTFVSVQGSLAMSALHKFGSEDQKQRWLPGMAAGDLVGAFALTEPEHGSDSDARDILGGNGLLIEHHIARHLTDMEVVPTYEGTDSIQALIVGRDVTGISAFS